MPFNILLSQETPTHERVPTSYFAPISCMGSKFTEHGVARGVHCISYVCLRKDALQRPSVKYHTKFLTSDTYNA